MTFADNGGRPGDQRGFLHKSFIGKAIGKAVTTFVPGASTAVDVFKTGRALLGRSGGRGGGRSFGRGRGRATVPRTSTARVTEASGAEKEFGRSVKFGGAGTPAATISLPFVPGGGSGFAPPCDFPKVIDAAGRCRLPTSGEFGGEQFGVGEAVMGRYGAALQPGSQIIDRAICLPGMQLGDDGLCYNKSQITNKQRMWPAGRKPLLSGGDMNAINTAARVGRRLEGATKRLQRLGLMKKPGTRRALPAHRHAKAATGVVSV